MCVNSFFRLAKQCISAVYSSPKKNSFLVATHNEESVGIALRHIRNFEKLPPKYQHRCAFAQVYGMADNISVPLGKILNIVIFTVHETRIRFLNNTEWC